MTRAGILLHEIGEFFTRTEVAPLACGDHAVDDLELLGLESSLEFAPLELARRKQLAKVLDILR